MGLHQPLVVAATKLLQIGVVLKKQSDPKLSICSNEEEQRKTRKNDMRTSKIMEKINMSQLLPLNFQGMVQIKKDVRANSSKK